jgi:hypothetical protein
MGMAVVIHVLYEEDRMICAGRNELLIRRCLTTEGDEAASVWVKRQSVPRRSQHQPVIIVHNAILTARVQQRPMNFRFSSM